MDLSPAEFRALLRDVRANSFEAGVRLFRLCQPAIRRAIWKRWNRKLQAFCTQEDLAQEAWCEFARGPLRQVGFTNLGQVIHYLAAIAHSRVVRLVRRQFPCQKRDPSRECPLESLRAGELDRLWDRQSTPEEAAADNDAWQSLLRRLPQLEQDALALLHQGYLEKEVAYMLGIAERTVRRIVGRAAALATC